MSVYKPAKSRFWQYDFQHKGRRFHGSTGVETRRKAEAVERRIREDLAAGKAPPCAGDPAPLTLDQAAGRWWIEVGQHLAQPQHIDRRIDICLRLLGASTPLADITTRAISRAIEIRRGETFTRRPDRPGPEGKARRYPVSAATVNADLVGILRRILGRARRTWETPGLPEIDWQALTLKEPAARIQYYTAEERTAWIGQCDPVTADALQILLTYGLRYGELFFPPAAYDGDGDQPRLVLARRKGDVPHVIPLRADDARMIAARVGRATAAGLDHIWFEEGKPNKGAGRSRKARAAAAAGETAPLISLTYLGLQARLRSAARRAGITAGRVIHGARHDAGTQILRRSQNLKIAQALLGHRDIKSTLRYAHVLEAEVRAALDSESRNTPEPLLEPGPQAQAK